MSAIVLLPEYAPPPPDWLGIVSVDVVSANNPQDFQIHYVSIANDATFGNILYTEPVSYIGVDTGSVTAYDCTFDWANDRLILSYASNLTGPIYVEVFQRLTGASVLQSTTFPTFNTLSPEGITLDVASTTYYQARFETHTWTYPFPNNNIVGNVSLITNFKSPGVNTTSLDIDKVDGTKVWTFDTGQTAGKYDIASGVRVLGFSAGGASGAAALAHGWDGRVYTVFDATTGGALAMHADDGSSGGTPINSKTNVLGSLPGTRNMAGVFAWNPAVPKPF